MIYRLRRIFLTVVGAGRRLHTLDEGQRAISNQRPFLFTVAFISLVAVAVSPYLFTEALFLLGLGLTVLSRVPSAVMPWQRYAGLLYWLIPLLQFLAIATLRTSGGDVVLGISLVTVFPVIWLAWFARRPLVAHTVSFLASSVIVWVPVFLFETVISFQSLAAPMTVPLIMVVISVFASNVSRSIDAQQEELLTKDLKLREAAAEASHHAQLLDTVIEAVPVGVVVVDAQGNDVMMNSQQRRVHQLGVPADVADPREDQLLVFGPDKVTPVPSVERPVRRAIEGASFTHQLIWLGDERGRRALSVSASPIEDASGDSAGSVIVFNDVTQLVEALEVKDAFLHGVTHELRTPLTSILGYIDLALEQAESAPETADLVANLRVAERNAARLLGLVSDLLDTAAEPNVRIRAGNLAEVVRSSLISARPQAEAKDITLVDQTPPSLPGHFDADRMHQVLDNLISNAIKYSSAGDIVTARAWSDDGAALVLQIRDTGRGISAADQQQLFEKFFRTSSVRESTIAGLGLGLPLTKAMVEAHRGTITVDSTPGEGTTFTVTLPGASTAVRDGKGSASTP